MYILVINTKCPLSTLLCARYSVKLIFLILEKCSPFECGFDPKSLTRIPFSLHLFLITIIFNFWCRNCINFPKQRLHNSAKSGERSVLTLGSLCLPILYNSNSNLLCNLNHCLSWSYKFWSKFRSVKVFNNSTECSYRTKQLGQHNK